MYLSPSPQWNTTQLLKKEWNFSICKNMDGLAGHYAKWNKSDREKDCMLSLPCGTKKKKKIQQTSEYDKKKQTEIQRTI